MADLVLVPVQPSPFDVWSTDAIVQLIKARQEATNGKPKATYMVSRAISNTALQRSLAEALSQQSLSVLVAGTTQRVVYATTASRGETVYEGRPTAARQEIEAIRDEIKEFLNDDE